MSNIHTLTVSEFTEILGATNIPPAAQQIIQSQDLRYQLLTPDQRDRTILDILQKLDNKTFSQVGQHRQGIWESAWSEYLNNFSQQDFDLDTLIPRFISANPIIRLKQDYVQALDAKFELNFFRAMRVYLFQAFLGEYDHIYEFGCGSGYNLIDLANLYPDRRIYGLDWAEAAVQIANLMGSKKGLPVEGRQFDFFNPDYGLEVPANSAFFTMCALEQIGDRYEAMLQFILDKKPALCLNMEPLEELYDQAKLVDYMAYKYHSFRGYLSGYLTRLQALAADSQIEILHSQRVKFGSLYHEGYSFVVWKPKF